MSLSFAEYTLLHPKNNLPTMLTSQNHLKFALTALIVTILAACGSGGSDLISYSAPTFSAGFIAISVQENTTGVIYTAQATDAEGDSITYSLFGGVDQAKFSIDASSGELRFIKAPDYEVPDDDGGDRIYEVRISASDSLDSSSMMLTVTITDVAEATDSVPLPTDFAATAGDANVTLTWTPSELYSTTYTIYRSRTLPASLPWPTYLPTAQLALPLLMKTPALSILALATALFTTTGSKPLATASPRTPQIPSAPPPSNRPPA